MLEHGRGPSEQHELQALGAGRSNDRREDPEGEGEERYGAARHEHKQREWGHEYNH